ncbi:hypothetical protein SAMN05216514_1253 [Kandleria vitulina]|nr:hypothetical protein SAMN05216514_1253 [Kandleria vitulina]
MNTDYQVGIFKFKFYFEKKLLFNVNKTVDMYNGK